MGKLSLIRRNNSYLCLSGAGGVTRGEASSGGKRSRVRPSGSFGRLNAQRGSALTASERGKLARTFPEHRKS